MGCGLSIFTSGDRLQSHGRSVRNRADAVAETSLAAATHNNNTTTYGALKQRRSMSSPRMSLNEQLEWPPWLVAVVGDVIKDWKPRSANTFQKIQKIGEGTYSNVYKAKDLMTGKIVALKKVRIDELQQETIKFMAREILILRKLDHPNVLKLEGATFSLPQIKCYMKQLFAGLEHCHTRGVLHRDIKGSNLLVDDDGNLKIADFGLACFHDTNVTKHMTTRVVTLWYRPPELLLGATIYGVGVDLWSAGCILAELLANRAILPGRTEVEQLHKIFKLCGSPSDGYRKKHKLPKASYFTPRQPYKHRIKETFKTFPTQSLPLICTLLSLEPDDRGTATLALRNEFFRTEPLPCEPSSLPKYPPCKEIDVKLRDEDARRKKSIVEKSNADVGKNVRRRAMPAPEANAEVQTNLYRRRNQKCKSEKFPPPHQDGGLQSAIKPFTASPSVSGISQKETTSYLKSNAVAFRTL